MKSRTWYVEQWQSIYDYIDTVSGVRASHRAAYGLKRSNRARSHPSLAGRLLQARRDATGEYRVQALSFTFSEVFADHVGSALPMGISSQNRSMIVSCSADGRLDHWTLAVYLDFTHPVVLWKDKGEPEWLRWNG